MIKPIEMIGTMILNGADDLLKQYKSIDFPVKRYFILDNSMGKDDGIREALATIQSSKHPCIEEVVVVTNFLNVGFSGSVNQIIKQNTDCPYWCVLSVDWHPKPGHLKRLANRLMEPFTAILCDKSQNGYSAMVFNPELLYEIGYLDENFFPAYYEDNDHRYRMKLAGLEWEYFPLEYKHIVSATIKRDPVLMAKNQKTFKENGRYYIEKWGGLPGQEKYLTPFDMDLPLDYWLYDPTRSQRQRWI
jgi:hypothetical protein